LGQDELVMNLRPTDKSKHIAHSHLILKGQTYVQRMQDDSLLYRNKHLSEDELGLPPINQKIAKMNRRVEKETRRRSLNESIDSQPTDKGTKSPPPLQTRGLTVN
jgi:hypothetical protein